MQKQLLTQIQKLENKKQAKQNKLLEKQKEIDELDISLKKLYAFKKEYERLENKSKEYLTNFKK